MKKSQDLTKTQIIVYLILSIGTIYWLASDDLEDAGLVSADKPDVVMQRPADDQDDIHYMLITVAANQAAADAAYQKGVDALSLKQSGMIASMERAAGEVDRGVISMANAKEEKTKTIANVKARQDMRDGLHILWQINTVRRNWLQEYATAIKSGSEPAMLAVARKYKEVMPSLAPAALKALEKFRAAKSDVGLGNNLREFSQ